MSDTEATIDGHVSGIFITANGGDPMTSCERVVAIAGAGLEGDRYANQLGSFSDRLREDRGREVTFIASEAIAAAAEATGTDFSPIESRRNITTTGVALNDLIGTRFRVGGAVIEAAAPCLPCTWLEELSGKPVMRHLLDAGGIRCRVIETGEIRLGDTFHPLGAIQEARA